MIGESLYLADTNILIRLMKPDDPQYDLVRISVHSLRLRDIRLAFTLQNVAELWNASTRPAERNGLGLTAQEVDRNVVDIEQSFTFLPDTESVYQHWRRLVVQYQISGVQVHDARPAAAMYAHGIANILTFNVADFRRFEGLTALHPSQIPARKL